MKFSQWFILSGQSGSDPYFRNTKDKEDTIQNAVWLFHNRLEPRIIPKLTIVKGNYTALEITPIDKNSYSLTINDGTKKDLIYTGRGWVVFAYDENGKLITPCEKKFKYTCSLLNWCLTERR